MSPIRTSRLHARAARLGSRARRLVLGCGAALALAWPTLTLGQAPSAGGSAGQAAVEGSGITLELNKLEGSGGVCRSYFVVANRGPETLKDLRLEMYLFDRQGIAMRRVALPFTDVRAGRTKVVIFDLADLACSDLDKLIVNEVLSCTGETGQPIKGCPDLLTTRSRATAAFVY